MKTNLLPCILCLATLFFGCKNKKSAGNDDLFPEELISFTPHSATSIFSGTGNAGDWDEKIRERGFIVKEDSAYFMWYTGYTKATGDSIKYLGLATSGDGITWKRHSDNPIHKDLWIEDVFVFPTDSLYYMFAESRGDTAHLLVSKDKISWTDRGAIDIRLTNGKPIGSGPFGTPAVWWESGKWYLFYERNDAGVWLATSKDMKVWTNVQDEPVLQTGPEKYDRFAVAMNQVIRHKGRYYAYYHASAFKDWREWTTNIAVSDDLVHWTKYPNNPIMTNNESSGIVVPDGDRYRLYTMHPAVKLYLPKKD